MRLRLGAGGALACLFFFSLAQAGSARVTGAATIKKMGGTQSSISCGTASLCYAAGGGYIGDIVKITNGTPSIPEGIPGTDFVDDISCPSATFCEAVAETSAGAALVTIPNGQPGKPQKLSFTPTKVSCPTATKCIIAGTHALSSSRTLEAAVVTNGKVGTPSTHALPKGTNELEIDAFSCASASACELTGDGFNDAFGGGFEFFVGLGAGAAFGHVHIISAGQEPLLGSGVACPPAAGTPTCYVTGDDGAGHDLFSVKVNGSTLKPVATSSDGFGSDRLACRGLKSCTSAGSVNFDTPAIVTFTSGNPGKTQTFSKLAGKDLFFFGIARPSPTTYIGVIHGQFGGTPTQIVFGTVS